MKLMCVYDGFAHDTSPGFGDVCHVNFVHYDLSMPDGITAYSLQEHTLPYPYRFGAWRKGPGNRLVPTFIRIEEGEFEETESAILEEGGFLYVPGLG